MKKVRWGIIGCGHFGANTIAPAIRQARGGELVSIQRRRREQAAATARRFGLHHFCSDEREMLAGDLVDAVFIASPNALHGRQTILAAEYGKHVLVEKPMSLHVREARQMIAACRRAGVSLMVGQSHRYYPGVQEARKMIRAGRLGRMWGAQAHFSFDGGAAARSWLRDKSLAGGGAMMDIGVHLIDTLRHVFDDEVAAVTATMIPRPVARRVDEFCFFTLRFRRGARAQVNCSFCSPYVHAYSFFGEKGSAYIGPREDSPLRHYSAAGRQDKGLTAPAHIRREVELFNRHLLRGGPNPVTGEEGLKNMLVIEAAYRAAASGREEKVAN